MIAGFPQTPELTFAAVQVARYRAALKLIDQAEKVGLMLTQDDAAVLADAAVHEYVTQLSAAVERRGRS